MTNIHATKVIAALDGTAAVARIFGLSMPSVSNWKREGIPDSRMMYLRAVKAAELEGIDLDAATAPGHRQPTLEAA